MGSHRDALEVEKLESVNGKPMKPIVKYLAVFALALSGLFVANAQENAEQQAISLPSAMLLPQEGEFSASPAGVAVTSAS